MERPNITKWQRSLLCISLKELADAISCREDDAFKAEISVERAENAIKEFFGERRANQDFTKEEAKFSQIIHTILRKNYDTYETSLLHYLIDKSFGMYVWVQFVKHLYKKTYNFDTYYSFDCLSFEDHVMRFAIGAVGDKWLNILDIVKNAK